VTTSGEIMSERDKPRDRRSGFTTIPPELRSLVGQRERPEVQRRGEDEKLDAAFEGLKAVEVEKEQITAPVQVIDPSRGAGNARAYVAPVTVQVPSVTGPVTEAPKVEIAAVVKAPSDRPPPPSTGARTVGGRTARLIASADAAVEVPPEASASPWAHETAVAPIALADLPSSHAPMSSHEPVARSERPAPAPRGRVTAALGGLALLGLLVLLVMALRPRAPIDETPVSVPAGNGTAPLLPAMSGSAPVLPSASASGAPAASSASVAPGPTGALEIGPKVNVAPGVKVGAPPGGKIKDDDPYDAASPPSLPKTASPAAPPAPTVAPPAVPSVPSALPTAKPPVGGDRLFWN
jgi:hypothetical protein